MQSDSERQELRRLVKESAASRNAREAVRYGRSLMEVSQKPIDRMFCASTFGALADEIVTQLGARRLKVGVVRSVTVEPVLPFLATEAVLENYVLDVQVGAYGSYVDDLLNAQSELARSQPDAVLVLLDMEELAGRLPDVCAPGTGAGVEKEIEDCVGRVEQLLRSFRSGSSARMVLQGLMVPDRTSLGDPGDANLPYSLTAAVTKLNRRLAELCRSISGCIFFDVDRLAARYGRARWQDARMFHASRLQVAAEFFPVYARGLVQSLSALFRAPRKVLCTDLDNTLWGGILGEDGPGGIATGSAFPGNCFLEYQKYLKRLASRGVLLAIASKNNEADVLEAFEVRKADLALTLDDFVARKIHWREKSDSLRELAEELSLGLDSFVFVDDNPVEREAVKRQLPEVAVVPAPAEEPWKLVEALAERSFFDTVTVTGDDVNRVQEYRAQAKRAELASSAGSRDAFLASLGMVCTFQSALEAPLTRAVQLLAKTNQFNLTTRRHGASEVESFASEPGGLAVVVRVRDQFGDAGVVGLALARSRGDVCHIDSLLLSCRVIGRGVETALLACVADHAVRTGARYLLGEFIPTKKNSLCENFYPEHGFDRKDMGAAHDGAVFYEMDLTTAAVRSPQWILVEGKEPHEQSASTALSS